MPLLGFFRRDSRIFALNYVERILFSMCFKVEMRSFRLNYVKLMSSKRYFRVSVAFLLLEKDAIWQKSATFAPLFGLLCLFYVQKTGAELRMRIYKLTIIYN